MVKNRLTAFALFCQTLKIFPGRILKYTKFELRDHSQNVIENIGLDAFLTGPLLIITEDIYFNRNAVLIRLQLTNYKCQVIMYLRMMV